MATTVQGSITTTTWGSVNGQEIKKFTLRNRAHQEVDVITYGATLTAIRTPDKEGNIADVVLGFDNIEGTIIRITHLYETVFDKMLTLSNRVYYHYVACS